MDQPRQHAAVLIVGMRGRLHEGAGHIQLADGQPEGDVAGEKP